MLIVILHYCYIYIITHFVLDYNTNRVSVAISITKDETMFVQNYKPEDNPVTHQTLDIQQADNFLHINKEAARRLAVSGKLLGAKVGRITKWFCVMRICRVGICKKLRNEFLSQIGHN